MPPSIPKKRRDWQTIRENCIVLAVWLTAIAVLIYLTNTYLVP